MVGTYVLNMRETVMLFCKVFLRLGYLKKGEVFKIA